MRHLPPYAKEDPLGSLLFVLLAVSGFTCLAYSLVTGLLAGGVPWLLDTLDRLALGLAFLLFLLVWLSMLGCLGIGVLVGTVQVVELADRLRARRVGARVAYTRESAEAVPAAAPAGRGDEMAPEEKRP